MATGKPPTFCYACWNPHRNCVCRSKEIKIKQSNETVEGLKREPGFTDEEKQHLSNALKLYLLENLREDSVVQACVSIHLKLGIKDDYRS